MARNEGVRLLYSESDLRKRSWVSLPSADLRTLLAAPRGATAYPIHDS